MTDVKIVANSITKAELLRMARERFVENAATQEKVRAIVKKLVIS